MIKCVEIGEIKVPSKFIHSVESKLMSINMERSSYKVKKLRHIISLLLLLSPK